MKYILYILLPVILGAQNIASLYENIQNSNVFKSSVARANANLEQTKASYYQDEWNIGGNLGYANVRNESNGGNEFGLSISKTLNLGGDPLKGLIETNEKYISLFAKAQQNRMKAQIWKIYGKYCITMEALQAKASLSNIYDEIRLHIQKGVKYGEFDASKGIMAQLSLDNLNLQISKLENALQIYEATIKTIVEFDGQFECKNRSLNFNKLFNPTYSTLWPMLQNKKEIQRETLLYTQEGINTIDMSLTYNNEIDTDRYTLNINLPLNYNSSKNEAKQKAALSKLSAVSYEIKALQNSYKHETSTLKNRISIYNKYLKDTEKAINKSADILIAHSNMRFLAGEESLISMFKATETKLQMIETILQLKVQRHNAIGAYMYKYAIDPKEINHVK